MNLSDFRTRVARVTGLSTSNSDDLDLIDDWVNEGVLQLLRDTKVNQITAALSVTAGSGDYTLDSDILSMSDLWYSPSDGVQNVVLEPVNSLDIQRMRLAQGAADVTPRYYALQGANTILLYPEPGSSSDELHITYVPRPAALSATADSPSDSTKGNIPSEFHSIIEAYAKWKAAEAEEHKPSQYGLSFQAEYERGTAKIRADMNRKAGVFKGKKTPGRRPVWPLTPGTDLRT